MREPPPQAGYVFDRESADHARLVRSSETLSSFTVEACRRAGLDRDGRAIDVGCGPCGALPALADLVGRAGSVVGLDSSPDALTVARSILDRLGHRNVTLVSGELATLSPAALCPPGPFDVAYVRRFLVHQHDPVDSLVRIARLVRPGGRVIAHEIPPGSGFPALNPVVPALPRVDELVHAAVQARGGTHDAALRLAALARDAGLRLVSQRGFVPSTEPLTLLEIFQGVLRSLRSVLITKGVATEGEIDHLLRELEEAKGAEYISSFGNLYIEMIAEVP